MKKGVHCKMYYIYKSSVIQIGAQKIKNVKYDGVKADSQVLVGGLLNSISHFIFNIKYLLHTSIYTIRSIFRHD